MLCCARLCCAIACASYPLSRVVGTAISLRDLPNNIVIRRILSHMGLASLIPFISKILFKMKQNPALTFLSNHFISCQTTYHLFSLTEHTFKK